MNYHARRTLLTPLLRVAYSAALLLACGASLAAQAAPAPARTQLVSFNQAGTASANGESTLPAISADGRYVAFQSKATDLTATPDLNNTTDVFVRDTQTGATVLVSVDSTGAAAANGESTNPSISADGRYVVFTSMATNIVSAVDTNNVADVYVRDLQTGVTQLVSVTRNGVAGGHIDFDTTVISSNGRTVVFTSNAPDLSATNDTNNGADIFARDLQTGTTKLVSINSSSTDGSNSLPSFTAVSISADGRFVVFESQASNLVANDTNGHNLDVFVRDLQLDVTTLVSVNSNNTGSGNFNADFAFPHISADGRFVVFQSKATNLVSGVTYVNAGFTYNVYERDLVAGTTRLVSLNATGTATGNNSSGGPVVNADGRYVAFLSVAGDLVANDHNGFSDVYVRDMQTGVTRLVSVNPAGTDGVNNFLTSTITISNDGRYVFFVSKATNLTLVPDTLGGQLNDPKLFVRDLQTGVTNIITISTAGVATEFEVGSSYAISADGRAVAFAHFRDDLPVPPDTNHAADIFLYDNTLPISIIVGGASVLEGDAGQTDLAVSVYLSAVSAQTVTVNYATADATAVAPDDYAPVAGTLTFNPGETSKTIHVAVNGDLQTEPNEFFAINLSQPVGALPGNYGVAQIVNDDPRPTLQFTVASSSVSESAARASISVRRLGNSNRPVTVDYMTVDDPAPVRCDDTVNNHGAAYARCDYATTVDTLSFAPGETFKTFTIPIVNDAHVEGDETVQLRLFNPTGGDLGTQSTASLKIIDDDTATTPDPIFNSAFFVRQQYLDFLSREPDTAGFNSWLSVLNNCADVNNVDPDSPAASCDRIHVSSSFLGSQEFQLKGFFVFRFYRVAFDRLPKYTEIVADMRSVTGTTASEVFAKKATFTNAFAQRPEFINTYGATTNANFVGTLLNRYGLTSITTPDPAQPDGTNKVTLTSADLIAQLDAQTLTRAQVLRAVADSDQINALEFNRAFVGMQYYGYLRRTPETSGFNAWLNYLNAHPTDFRTMVNGFMNSPEYRLRFGPAQ